MRLIYLCDVALTSEGAPTLIRPYTSQEGTVFGLGDGTLSGQRLRGTLRFANHAHRRGDGVMLPDMRGVLTTDDGALVSIRMQGRVVWAGQDGDGDQLVLVSFATEDTRYQWLNTAFCVMEGKVAVEAGRPRQMGAARLYLCVNELLSI